MLRRNQTRCALVIGLSLLSMSALAFSQAPTVAEVQPTALGLQRINARRQSLGKSPLNLTPRMIGDDTITVESLLPLMKNTNPTLDTEISASLPSFVDNSVLPSFPPPLQQYFGDCQVVSPAYYVVTHNMGLALGYDNKSSFAHRCSPAFAAGLRKNDGWCSIDGFTALGHNLIYGCAPLSDIPYTASFGQSCAVTWGPFPSDVMTRAQDARLTAIERVPGTNRDLIKRLLVNGYAVSHVSVVPHPYAYVPIQANPIRGANAWVGQPVLTFNDTNHEMALVGYDDDAWFDLNKDGIMTPDELGVWRVADSGFLSIATPQNFGAGVVPGFFNIPYALLQDPYVLHAVPRSPAPRKCHLPPQIVSLSPQVFDLYLYNPSLPNGGTGGTVRVNIAIKNPNAADCAPAQYHAEALTANWISPFGGNVTVAGGATGTAVLYYRAYAVNPANPPAWVAETPFSTTAWVEGPDQSTDPQTLTFTYHAYSLDPQPITSPSPAPSVSPGPDTLAPRVAIASPTAGKNVGTKTFQLQASGTDNVSITGGTVLLDGAPYPGSTFVGSSVSLSMSPKSWKRGSHTITVQMRDPSGNVGQASVTVNR